MRIWKPGKHLTLALACALFTGSLWYLLEHFEWRDAFSRLLETDFVKLVGIILIAHLAYLCVRTWRWLILVRHSNPSVGFFDLYWITAVVVSLAILTPGQSGEALKVELLKQRGLLDRLPGLGVFAFERIFDLMAVVAMGLVGLIFGSGISDRYPGLAIGAGVFFAIGMIGLYVLSGNGANRQAPNWLKQMRAANGTPTIWLGLGLLTLLSWSLIGFCWKVSLASVGIDLSLQEILWLISLVTLGTVLSFIPGGLGVAEVLTVNALMHMGASPVAAQAGALILRAYALIVVVIGVGHLLYRLLGTVWSRSR